MKKNAHRAPRGFALLIVLVLAAAAVAMGGAVLVQAGRAKTVAIHAQGADVAQMIAQSGLEHAEAYAREVIGSGLDYDRVLDPNLDANCVSLLVNGDVPETGNMFLPTFGATDTLSAPFNKRFKRVAVDGGAYFVRFEDNHDDILTNNLFAIGTTNNNVNGASVCLEGSTVGPRLGADNPARDRDGAIWVTVIGIFPGTDETKAKHRAVVRKLILPTSGAPTLAPPAIQAGQSIQVGNGPGMELCSAVAGIAAGDTVDVNGCACNEVTAGQSVSQAPSTCNGCPTACGEIDASIEAAPALPAWVSGANVRAPDAWDFTTPCNFYMSDSMYFWNAEGGNACETYVGPLPDPGPAFPGSCWVTLNATLPWSGGPEFDGVFWRPRGASTAVTATGPVNKPDWSLACPKDGAPSDFDFRPPSGTTDPSCTACDGTVAVWQRQGQNDRWVPLNNNFRAFPVGVYFTPFNFSPNANWGNPPDSPGVQNDLNAWPMITIASAGNIQTGGGDRWWAGFGSAKNNHAALIASGNIQLGNGSRVTFNGSVLAGGNVQTENGSFNNSGFQFFGMIMARGNVQGGKMRMLYEESLAGAGPPGPPPEPLRLSIPIAY